VTVVRLAECTFVEAGRLAADARSVVLLPLGALEEHGPHLPLLVDWLGAEEIARRLAAPLTRAGLRPVLAPALPYGASPLARGFPGTVSLSRATLRQLIVEIVRELIGHGFRRFVLCNYQADPEHLGAMDDARRRLQRTPGVRVLFAGFTPAGSPAMTHPKVGALLRSARPEYEWHSGEMETSTVLALAPRLVRRRLARRLRPVRVDFRAGLRRRAPSFKAMDPKGRGYFGSPALARAETGRRAMALRVKLIAAELVAALRAR
jgi:creatinine amidohydrolase